MKPFNPDGPVMTIVNLVLELDKYKKAYKKAKAENECLKRLIQTKQSFEVRA